MTTNWLLLSPEFMVTGLAFLVFTIDFFLPRERKRTLGWIAFFCLAGILAFSLLYLWGREEELFRGIFRADSFSLFFKGVFLVIAMGIVLVSMEFVDRYLAHPGEYYGILLMSIVGMMLLAAARELLTAYISLELLSFSLYTLVCLHRQSPKSNEAGVKYVLLGAFSSAILLYGISLVYGTLGTTTFEGISRGLEGVTSLEPMLLVGLVLIVAGLGFKVAAVPFHMWAPDIYEGAPLPITAYIAIGSKAGGFALILRLFSEAFLPAIDQWSMVLAVVAALTMSVGNLVALTQSNIKRLMAYSSISQVGYLLMGVVALSSLGSNGLMLHLVGYGVTNMALFGVIIVFYNASAKDGISDFAGLADRAPFMAVVMCVALFSLAGLPFFAGFTTKFYLFTAAANEGFLWLSGLAIFNSLISLYYYLMVIKQMYMVPAASSGPIKLSVPMGWLLAVLVLGIFFIGVYPAPLVDVIDAATSAILP